MILGVSMAEKITTVKQAADKFIGVHTSEGKVIGVTPTPKIGMKKGIYLVVKKPGELSKYRLLLEEELND